MTAHEQVRRIQRLLQAATGVAALAWGVAVWLLLRAGGHVIARDRPGHGDAGAALAVAGGAAVALWFVWRARGTLSARRVALWIEERVPSLQYALVTASDPTLAAPIPALDAAVRRANVGAAVAPTALRGPLAALAALAVAALATALAAAPGRQRATILAARALSDAGAAVRIPSRLVGIHAQVAEPAYAGSVIHELDDPTTVSALAGSTITVSGAGGPIGVGARLADRMAHVAGSRDEWRIAFGVPRAPVVLTLTDRRFTRSIAVIPVADQPPAVALDEPAHDSIWQAAPAALALVARARDDIGLGAGRFEFTITSGSGEIFKSHMGTLAETPLAGTAATLRTTWLLAPLGLGPGDVVSVRAVVQDRNTVTGPGTATSDTRTFRIARPGELDSLAVEAAPPPPVQQSLLTERMLIVAAESLLRVRPRMAAARYTAAARRIGADQADLRKRVYNMLYQQDEAGAAKGVESDDEELDPQLVINRDLKAAYDAMWEAERSLAIAEIPRALAPMRLALAALDRARLANRLYLRGAPPRIVVDVDRVRLTGKEKGAPSTATSRPLLDSARFDDALAAAAQLRGDPGALGQAITRLQVRAAPTHPRFAAALGAVTDSLRRHGDVRAALGVARRALEGAPRVSGSLPWGGAWGGSAVPR